MPAVIVAYEDNRCIQCVSIIPKNPEDYPVYSCQRCTGLHAKRNVEMGGDDVGNRIINHPQHHCSCVKNQFPKLLK